MLRLWRHHPHFQICCEVTATLIEDAGILNIGVLLWKPVIYVCTLRVQEYLMFLTIKERNYYLHLQERNSSLYFLHFL